ncbi:hypothetical protein [Demequina salsinemoris]|uniref:hypothetical protein n=1 Tax=Demequina salsinemoris TaxID=577470 RepID=UPI00078338E2|nr:hypothetical protein [Demequina salsinemoris]
MDVATGDATAWSMVTSYSCAAATEDTGPTVAELAVTAWASLEPGVPEHTIQPDQGWVYSTVPTIAYVEPDPVIISRTLLGVPVRIRATPTSYEWTWGDGETTTTTDPGQPYPNETISHTYTAQQTDVSIVLETTWAGSYSIDGGAWIDIDGTITSTSATQTLEVRTVHSKLVDCDLNGNCLDG